MVLLGMQDLPLQGSATSRSIVQVETRRNHGHSHNGYKPQNTAP